MEECSKIDELMEKAESTLIFGPDFTAEELKTIDAHSDSDLGKTNSEKDLFASDSSFSDEVTREKEEKSHDDESEDDSVSENETENSRAERAESHDESPNHSDSDSH
jgi:hypothetical protein